jgi:hypothetical protein
VKIDADNPRYFSLLEHPGEVVVAVRKRTEWEMELSTMSELGREGAWYVDEDERKHVPLEPFSEDGEGEQGNWRSLLFRLRPPEGGRELRDHRFLFRFWSSDVHVPSIKTSVFILRRHERGDGGATWELRTPAATLYGIGVGGPPV